MRLRAAIGRTTLLLVLSMLIFMDLTLGAVVPLTLLIFLLLYESWRREDERRKNKS